MRKALPCLRLYGICCLKVDALTHHHYFYQKILILPGP